MFAVLAGVGTLVWERKNWTLQRLIAMPLRKSEFIGGKILSRMTIGVIEFAVAFAAGAVIAALTSVTFGGAPFAIALVALAFSFMTSALALLVATLVGTTQQASGVTTLLALTLAPIGGAWWSLDLEFIPEIMRQAAVISPFYWAMEGFKSVIMYGGGLADVVLHAGVLAALGIILFGAAIARFRYP
jgi:ABC-2 type transport system permease protein